MEGFAGDFGSDYSDGRRTPRVLMVCLGNICRSPMAQGVLEAAARGAGLAVDVDSAGTSGWHIGAPADPRAIAACSRRGVDIIAQRCRQVEAEDFVAFDLILAMDARNLERLAAIRPRYARAGLGLLLDFGPGLLQGADVQDPYFEGMPAFERTLDIVSIGVEGLLRQIACASVAAHRG